MQQIIYNKLILKKLFLYIFVVFTWCSVGFAEIYACSGDLTRYGRPGEIETKLFSRKGSFFYNHHDFKFKIHFEDDRLIHLVKTTTSSGMFIVIIDKKTKEFTEKFMSIEDSRKIEKVPQMYGKCVEG